jgi:succinoglycan biosynthesis transport protein ExoP
MEKHPLIDDPRKNALSRNGSKNGLLRPGRQYVEMPIPEVFEESGPDLPEYLQILRRRKGTLILIVFLGLLISLLLTISQTPVYDARGSIEIQNFNENFLNMRNVSPTADDGGSYAPGTDLQTQAGILQSESLLDRVAAKLDLGKKLFPEERSAQFSAWRRALDLGGSRQVTNREKILNLITANLKISTEANSRLVDIHYDSSDPQLAADFVNTLTAEFIKQNIESHWKTTQQTGEWLTRQMEDVRI